MHVPLRALFTLLFIPLYAAGLGAAAPADDSSDAYDVGDKFTAFSTKDQHDQIAYVSPIDGTRHLVVSFAMSPGKAANRYFEKKGAGFLDEHQALFLANIYGMPGIGRMFALPKMKKYPHRILLGDDEHLLDRIPEQKDKLTVLDFKTDGTIAAIRFLDPDQDLDHLFSP